MRMSAARQPLWYLCQEFGFPIGLLLVRQFWCALEFAITTVPKALDKSHKPCFRVGWLPFQFRPLTRHFALASAFCVKWILGRKIATVSSVIEASIIFFMIVNLGY